VVSIIRKGERHQRPPGTPQLRLAQLRLAQLRLAKVRVAQVRVVQVRWLKCAWPARGDLAVGAAALPTPKRPGRERRLALPSLTACGSQPRGR